jgi:RNA polymerase sigma factor (sigma-70 family)
MKESRTAALRKVVRAAVPDQSAETDRELIRRFAHENDQAAFEALVNRHTSMVLGVCRRALANVQDAEDACQAVFLVLANRARVGNWQDSVANWLYTTARKVAHNARVVAQRRAKRESGAAVPEAVEPVDRMTGRELLSALDAALDALPPSYREPLVLCYLEGLTRDEAAARLGIPLATLHTRIDRARKRLHAVLTRAGCTLGVGLLALAVSSPASASSPRLVQSILANASGSFPAAVGELAKGVAVNGLYRKLVLALAAVIVVALGVGLGSLNTSTAGQSPAGAAPEPAEQQPPKGAAAKPARKETTLTGRVLNPDGKPLAAAQLLAGRLDDLKESAMLAFTTRLVELKEVGTSGADGTFTVQVPAGHAPTLIARAEGVGSDFLLIPPDRLGQEIELRTVKDLPVRGRILDTQGKPIVGATVVVSKLDIGIDNSLDFLLADAKRGLPALTRRSMSKSLAYEAGLLSAATTDKDGRFTIEGAGAERVVTLRVSGAGLADTELLVVNRKDFDPKPYNEVKPVPVMGGGGGGRPAAPVVFHGPETSIVVESQKLIRGTVTDIDTGKPRVGVKVTLVGDGFQFVLPHLSAVTDAQGKYEIHGVRKSKSYAVAVESDPATRHLTARVRADDTAGFEPIALDIKVKKGVLVTGKVIDTGTKEAVRGFASAAILLDNKFVKDYPEFDMSPGASIVPGVIVATDEDGTFRVVTVPGPVLLMGGTIIGPDAQKQYKRPVPDPKYPQYFAARQPAGSIPMFEGYGRNTRRITPTQFCKVMEIKADAETVEQDVLLEPVK